ncbi:MAG: hypothetical protein II225_02580 [Ruminococcus sp.]|nr:hypothetical protein [Ruminococcus sp.]
MKKLISLLLVSLILCFSIGTVSVSAYEEDKWVLGPDAEYITNNGYTYYPVYPMGSYVGFEYPEYYLLEFADEETKAKYDGSEVYVSNYYSNYCVWVDLYYGKDMFESYISVLYVREDCMEQYNNFLSGEAEQYIVENGYKELPFKISKEQMENWLQGEKVLIPANNVYKYYHQTLLACDNAQCFKVECGTVLWDMSIDEFYLLKNSDYDSNKVYTVNDTLTVYKLEDEDVRERLALYISYVPEDDLEWMNPGFSEESDNTALFVLAGIFFGFIPFAVLALSVVMFFVTKTKSYRRGFVLMGIGSILILLAFVLMLLILL